MAKKAPTKRTISTTREALLEKFKDYPGLKAFERALDSPDGSTSLPILLKGDPVDACLDSAHQETAPLGAVKCRKCGKPMRYWHVHHVNTKQPGRVARVKAQAMVPVEMSELLNPEELSDLVKDSPDGLVHTGTNGVRVLYKIPIDLRNMRRRAEKDARLRRGSNPNKVKEDLANDAAAQYGSEAADLIYNNMEVSERPIRTTYADEAQRSDRDLDD